MKKPVAGVIFGILAGIIDVILMIKQNLTWDVIISVFAMWIVVGLLIASVDLKINSIIKGVVIALLVFLPSAILIGWNDPALLITITIMTTILGGLLGFTINRITLDE